MITINGKYNTANIYSDLVELEAIGQIKQLCEQEFAKDSHIAIMPDVHAGVGCTIGTTMTITDKVCPNLVGVDIGCGMYVMGFDKHTDFVRKFSAPKFDAAVKKVVPSGKNVWDEPSDPTILDDLNQLIAPVEIKYAACSLGTLGGGNHFIEVDKDDDNNLYIVVHSGSRHLGLEICKYYMNMAKKQCDGLLPSQINALISELKAAGRTQDIANELQRLKNRTTNIVSGLEYVSGDLLKDYLHDMDIAQKFAMKSRQLMISNILKELRVKDDPFLNFTTIHNYIDIDNMILRKGSVSAQKGEMLIIPMNMRDGSLICIGKGNPDWNYSAPHGAGRLMSRGKARASISLDKFRNAMKDVYSTTVCKETIDEAPFAYKPMKSIIDNIQDTVEVSKIIKPIYNFKASE